MTVLFSTLQQPLWLGRRSLLCTFGSSSWRQRVRWYGLGSRDEKLARLKKAYADLGLREGASWKEVGDKYRADAQVEHPDRNLQNKSYNPAVWLEVSFTHGLPPSSESRMS